MSRPLILASLIGGALAISAPAMAQGNSSACSKPKDITSLLRNDYSEQPVAFGLQGDGSLMQIYASKSGETWTVVLTTPAGMSCIVAEGQRWESLPRQSDDPLA